MEKTGIEISSRAARRREFFVYVPFRGTLTAPKLESSTLFSLDITHSKKNPPKTVKRNPVFKSYEVFFYQQQWELHPEVKNRV